MAAVPSSYPVSATKVGNIWSYLQPGTMASPRHTSPNMADVNERRKAQNRAAQKKYRELVDTCLETEPLAPQPKPDPTRYPNHVTTTLTVLPQEHDRNYASNSPRLFCAINRTTRPMW